VDETSEELRWARGSSVSKDEAKYILLAGMASPMARHLETIFTWRFLDLAADRLIYDIQQMQTAERRKYLRKLHRLDLTSGRTAVERRQNDRSLDIIEHDYLSRKLPEGGPPPLTFEDILNFEATYVVSVPHEVVKKDSEKIRNRLAAHLLAEMIFPPWTKHPYPWPAMAEAGIITSKEYREYRLAKGSKQRRRTLAKLWKKYFTLAWGRTPEAVYGSPQRIRKAWRRRLNLGAKRRK